MQLTQVQLLRNNIPYGESRLRIAIYENFISEEADFCATSCEYQVQYGVESKLELSRMYSKLKDTYQIYEVSQLAQRDVFRC